MQEFECKRKELHAKRYRWSPLSRGTYICSGSTTSTSSSKISKIACKNNQKQRTSICHAWIYLFNSPFLASVVVHSEPIHVSFSVTSVIDVSVFLPSDHQRFDSHHSNSNVARALNAMIHHVRHVCRPSGISCYLFWQNLTASTSEVLYIIFTSGPADLSDSFPRAPKIEVSFQHLDWLWLESFRYQ